MISKDNIFTNEFGTFTEGEPVIYSVYPLGVNISGLAYKDKIETIDAAVIAECESECMTTHCLWENVHDVKKSS